MKPIFLPCSTAMLAVLCLPGTVVAQASTSVLSASPDALHVPESVSTSSSTSSSPADFESASPAEGAANARALAGIQGPPPHPVFNRPFHSLSLTAKVGAGGIGFDAAMPVAPHLKVRAGAQFFGHNVGFSVDGIQSNADIQLQNVALTADVYPFHNGFHLSPGVTLNNANHVSSIASVPGGEHFTLGGNDFTSSVTDPVHGSGSIRLGDKIAPRFSVGWDDLLRHHGGHISVPVEFGFQYSSAPEVTLTLAGSACSQGYCGPVMADGRAADVQQEIVKLENDLRPLRFYPITSTGIRYTFGR